MPPIATSGRIESDRLSRDRQSMLPKMTLINNGLINIILASGARSRDRRLASATAATGSDTTGRFASTMFLAGLGASAALVTAGSGRPFLFVGCPWYMPTVVRYAR